MNKKEYLVELDNVNYDWTFLWNNTILALNGLSTRLEIISPVIPMVLVYTDRAGRKSMDYIEGIKLIEENELYRVDI